MKYLILPAILCLSACTTYPISGTIAKTGERFAGTTTPTYGTSTLNITTDNGVSCTGSYIAPKTISRYDGITANGTIICDDNREGTFTLVGDGFDGEGFGKFSNGQKFDFTYGNVSRVKSVK